MRTAYRAILAHLAIVGLIVGGQALAQAPRSIPRQLVSQPSPYGSSAGGAVYGYDVQYAGGENYHPDQGVQYAGGPNAQYYSPPGGSVRRVNAEQIEPTPAPEVSEMEMQMLQPQPDSMATGGPPVGGPCGEVTGEGYCCPPRWFIDQGIRTWARNRPRRTAITFDQGAAIPEVLVSTKTPSFDVAAGYFINFGYRLGRDAENRDHYLEVSYFGGNRWDEETAINGTRLQSGGVVFGSLSSQFPPSVVGFNDADSHFIRYESELHSAELNLRFKPRARADRLVLYPSGHWRREAQPGQYFNYLVGLRWLSVDEFFNFRGRSRIIDLGAGTDQEFLGNYDILTHNDLLGLQVGAELTFRKGRGRWGVRAKAGPFMNFCDQESQVFVQEIGGQRFSFPENSGDKTEVALFGEVSILGEYQIASQIWLKASYDFAWAVGMALAAEQLRFETNPAPFVNNNGRIFYQGLTLGVECRW